MTDIQQHQEYNKLLHKLILMAREQLMEDIDCIITDYFAEYDVNYDGELVKILCDAVCRNFPINWMKCEVKLYVAGKVFTEEVYAKDYQDAREVALARNPNAKVIGVTAKFNWEYKQFVPHVLVSQ